jgi:hypothetical protein
MAWDVVPGAMRLVMERLQERDARATGPTGHPSRKRLRAITPDVGQLLLTLALAVDARRIVEVGTSSGYSTLWLALAAQRNGGRVTTFEIDPAKVALATSTFSEAGVAGVHRPARRGRRAGPRRGRRCRGTSSSSTPRSGDYEDLPRPGRGCPPAGRPAHRRQPDIPRVRSGGIPGEGAGSRAAQQRGSSPIGNGELVGVRLPD